MNMSYGTGVPMGPAYILTGGEFHQSDAWKIVEVGSFGNAQYDSRNLFALGIAYRNVVTQQLELVFPTTVVASPPGFTQVTQVGTLDPSTQVVRY
jgi:hypothetical protein